MLPTDIDLPSFLDPILEYLSDTLPSPLYTFIIHLLSHSLALFTALFNLITSLASTNPLQWNAQTIIPPLISILAAYLALTSLYRTTSWMFRTSIWFVKWGTIFAALIAGASWCMGNAYGNNAMGSYGIISNLGGFILDIINDQSQNAAGGSRAQSKSRTSRSKTGTRRPKPWESFERQREWQYQENGAGPANQQPDVQQIMQGIFTTADRVFGENSWWNMAKSAVQGNAGGGRGEADEADAGRRSQPPRKAKAQSSKSKSR